MTIRAAYEVQYVEYERGWGSNHFDSNYFDSKEKAETEIKEYNAKNNLPQVPDYYSVARGPYLVEVNDDVEVK